MRNSILVRSIAAVSGIVMLASVAACGDNTTASTDSSAKSDTKTETVSGNFSGAGASSQQAAVEAWIAGFQGTNPDAKVAYNPSGSGAGVSTFLTGATAWAGSDAALADNEVEQSKSVCASGNAFDIPVYVSPIAVVFNLNGISGKGKTLNMDADTIAKIFDGKITKWNDDAIKQQNPKVDLPDLDITVVHRSDKSGTTKNFLSYVKDAAGDAWSYELGENWPNEVGQGAKGTSGVISTVQQADGTIGYADASQAGELGTVAVKVGDDYVPFSAEAAAKVVDASPARRIRHWRQPRGRQARPQHHRGWRLPRSCLSPTTSPARHTRMPTPPSSSSLGSPTWSATKVSRPLPPQQAPLRCPTPCVRRSSSPSTPSKPSEL